MNNRIATTWFGERERATCISVYTAAEFVGLAFLTPVLVWMKVRVRLALGVLFHRRARASSGRSSSTATIATRPSSAA